MPRKAAAAEADKASETFHLALAQIGTLATADALAVWREVPATPGVTASGWIDRLVKTILGRRRQSRDLARSYYRLVRALHTDFTIQQDGKKEASTTLTELRSDFKSKTDSVLASRASESTDPTRSRDGASEAGSGAPEPSEDEANDRILVEELARLEREAEAIERAAEEELHRDLESLGTNNLRKKLDVIDDELPASVVDKLRKQAHDEAGARQAATSSRVAQNGARSELWRLHQKDKRAIGYVRLSRTGTPCGWCAMLISRGPVYRSDKSATLTYDEGDQYHDNCNCYAMPVWSREQYNNSDLFSINRKYAELWPKVTKGLSGKSALSAWRYFIRQEEKAQRAREARPQDVQEA